MSKKLQQKQERRLAEQRRRDAQKKAARRSNAITIGIVAVIVVLVGVGVLTQRNASDDSNAPRNVGVNAQQAGCTDIETPEAQGANHVQTGTTVDYQTSPPTTGDHWEQPADADFYTTPIEPERLVHNMEHGQIVFWYRPDAPAEVMADLQDVVSQEPEESLAAPYDQLEDPYNFAMTAWHGEPNERGAIQNCERVSQEVVDSFRRTYQGRGRETIPGINPFTG